MVSHWPSLSEMATRWPSVTPMASPKQSQMARATGRRRSTRPHPRGGRSCGSQNRRGWSKQTETPPCRRTQRRPARCCPSRRRRMRSCWPGSPMTQTRTAGDTPRGRPRGPTRRRTRSPTRRCGRSRRGRGARWSRRRGAGGLPLARPWMWRRASLRRRAGGLWQMRMELRSASRWKASAWGWQLTWLADDAPQTPCWAGRRHLRTSSGRGGCASRCREHPQHLSCRGARLRRSEGAQSRPSPPQTHSIA